MENIISLAIGLIILYFGVRALQRAAIRQYQDEIEPLEQENEFWKRSNEDIEDRCNRLRN